MKSLHEPDATRELQARLRDLTAEKRPSWGRMSAPEMVKHLASSLRMALGDLPVAAKSTPFRFPIVKHLVIYALPWPEGAPTAPELISQPLGQWTNDVTELSGLMDRFRACDVRGPWPEHPLFGTLSGQTWGALMHRHIDHHFRQFGI
jgi:hypothetical protein